MVLSCATAHCVEIVIDLIAIILHKGNKFYRWYRKERMSA